MAVELPRPFEMLSAHGIFYGPQHRLLGDSPRLTVCRLCFHGPFLCANWSSQANPMMSVDAWLELFCHITYPVPRSLTKCTEYSSFEATMVIIFLTEKGQSINFVIHNFSASEILGVSSRVDHFR